MEGEGVLEEWLVRGGIAEGEMLGVVFRNRDGAGDAVAGEEGIDSDEDGLIVTAGDADSRRNGEKDEDGEGSFLIQDIKTRISKTRDPLILSALKSQFMHYPPFCSPLVSNIR